MCICTPLTRFSRLTRLRLGLIRPMTSFSPPEATRRRRTGRDQPESSTANKAATARNMRCCLCSLMCVALLQRDTKRRRTRACVCTLVRARACLLFLPFTAGDWLTVASNLKLTKINTSSPGVSHTHTHAPQPQNPQGERQSKTNTQPTLAKVCFL